MRKRTIDIDEIKKRLKAMGASEMGDVPDSDDEERFEGVPQLLEGTAMRLLLKSRGHDSRETVVHPVGNSGPDLLLSTSFEVYGWEGIHGVLRPDGSVELSWNVRPSTFVAGARLLEGTPVLGLRIYTIPVAGPISHVSWELPLVRGEGVVHGTFPPRIRAVLYLSDGTREVFLFSTDRLEPEPWEDMALGMAH